MKKSSRMQPVVKVAEGREQQAARHLGESQVALTQAQQRLDELKEYRRDYEQRFQTSGALGMGAAQMEDYRKFLCNLGRAIEQQTQTVAQSTTMFEQQRQRWFVTRGKAQALDNVVARYQAEEQRDLDRREQQEQDEHAMRGYHARE
ncbi:MAG: flagellar export protein FliJ [Gammaproteobacteria bacterium]|nr:flagellar export protein FliJ [Gammaproteobacteria bacterium]